jgi:tetrahydromethanopterin S-methyltransferase subunit B
MTMDWGTTAQWASVGLALTALIIAWLNRRTDAVEKLEKRVEGCERGITKVSGELEHLPGKDLVHTLQLAMTEMRGQMDVIAERVKPIQAIASRMQEAMLEGARK